MPVTRTVNPPGARSITVDPLTLLLQLIAGIAGSILVSTAFPTLDLGPTNNSAVGLLGGIIGGWVLISLGVSGDSTASAQILILSAAGGALGGALLTAFAGVIKHFVSRP